MINYILYIFFAFSLTIYSQVDSIISHYNNGNLKSVIFYKENVRDGEARFYWENGNTKQNLTYFNGRVNGLVRNYNEDGHLIEMYNIQDGKREGPTSYFDSLGVYQKDVFYTEGRLDIKVEPLRHSKSNEKLSSDESEKEDVNRKKEKLKVKTQRPLPPAIEEERNFEEDPAFYLSVEVLPKPVGGIEAILKKIFYPVLAKENKIEGTVVIRTYIDRDGEVLNAEVLKGIGYGCDESARNAVFYHRFKPGLQRGQRVKVQMDIPIEFKLPYEN